MTRDVRPIHGDCDRCIVLQADYEEAVRFGTEAAAEVVRLRGCLADAYADAARVARTYDEGDRSYTLGHFAIDIADAIEARGRGKAPTS
jgi:hypothetical protein